MFEPGPQHVDDPSSAPSAAESGVRLLLAGLEAFALRALSIRAAQHSIEVQMYMWRGDVTGGLLARELVAAADRGVQVRVLLDDLDARSRDAVLIALDGHRCIDIRLFNTFVTRAGLIRTALELFAHGARLNRRMHNKSWIVDRRLAIVGGRNVGDEYFAASEAVNFVDADALLVGDAVADAVRCFEEYWDSPLTSAVSTWRRLGRRGHKLRRVRADLENAARAALQSPYGRRLEDVALSNGEFDARDAFTWLKGVRVIADPPQKARGAQLSPAGVLRSVIEAIDASERELLLISPYFVPGAGGTAALRALVRRGVRVAVLTNSLAATDVAAVHSGYARYRESLLEGDVEIYELKPSFVPHHARRLRLGSSRASLHTKAVIVDGARLFVGSFNLDPRSAEINCEMGVWISGDGPAGQMRAMFDLMSSTENSYRVRLNADGQVEWRETANGQLCIHPRDPNASMGRRALTWLLQQLPIEAQL